MLENNQGAGLVRVRQCVMLCSTLSAAMCPVSKPATKWLLNARTEHAAQETQWRAADAIRWERSQVRSDWSTFGPEVVVERALKELESGLTKVPIAPRHRVQHQWRQGVHWL